MLTHETIETLHRMRLKGMAEAYHGQLQDPEVAGLRFDERFGLIVDIRQGLTARYYCMTRLIGDLTTAKADGSFPQLMAGLARTDVLVLDDCGQPVASRGLACHHR